MYNIRGELLWTGPHSGPLLGFVAPGRILTLHNKANGHFAGFDTIDIPTSAVTPSVRGESEPRHTLSEHSIGRIFAENGKTLCGAALVGSFKNYPVCWDVDTGRTIAEFRGVDGGEPASASTRGSRMVLSNVNEIAGDYLVRSGARSRPGAETRGGRVVWDFRSGTEVAAWRPSAAKTAWPNGLGVGVSDLFAPVAISPSGNYVAEAVGDELHIYQIPAVAAAELASSEAGVIENIGRTR